MIRFPRPRVLAEMAPDRHHAIEASAGTGKTFLIERRIADLILSNAATIDEIAVVTFTEKATTELRRRLEAIEQERSPFTKSTVKIGGRGTHWVQPQFVAQVEFSNWTGDALLRHPSFQGLREDKDAAEVIRDNPLGEQESPATNSHKAAPSSTKADPPKKRKARKSTRPKHVEVAPNGVTEVRSTSEILPDGRLHTKSQYLKEGQWVDGHEIHYKEAPDAKVVFK